MFEQNSDEHIIGAPRDAFYKSGAGGFGLMVVPLPTWLLDLLLATNLAMSVAILLVTIYVTGALEVAAFPTLLLITTLVRLALNVSSTRLILHRRRSSRRNLRQPSR